jgi:transcriptional regulator of acetoin/glycerol metabolism
MDHENTLLAGQQKVPTIPEVSLSAISRVWEHFVGTGEFGPHTPRAIIARSWEKSRKLGIDPYAARACTVLSAEEIEQRLRRDDLGRAGRPVLDQLAQTVEDTKHVIVLADAQGRILYSVGHRQIHHALDRINFRPGGDWAEDSVGPNGVGTPLALGCPEVVIGTEHYCRNWQPWVCYGAPITAPYGGTAPLGIIDITGPVQRVNQEAMALAVSIAQLIRSSLLVLHYQRRERLRALSRKRCNRWSGDALILLDEHGFIMDANERARALIGGDYPQLLDVQITTYLPDVWRAIERSLNDRNSGDVDVRLQGKAGAQQLRCRIEPVADDGACIGALLVLAAQPAQARPESARSSELRKQTSHYHFENILGRSPALREALRLAEAAAGNASEYGVLLIGETGTGKELIAHAIHTARRRACGPFIAINCGALPKDLIESELFGYAPGAFSGARREGLTGKFELAHNGTLFLDEIDSLSLDLQAKFLRVLDNKEVMPLGATHAIKLDVRIIAAASPELIGAVTEGRFRADLYHRLSVIEIPVPPLRIRGDDVLLLAEEFLERECWAAGRARLRLSTEVAGRLKVYHWPGNIRELRNLCVRWVLTVRGAEIGLSDLPPALRHAQAATPATAKGLRGVWDDLIRRTLNETGGNVSKAAAILGIDRSTIYRRMRRP